MKVPIPFVDEDVDFSDPTGALTTGALIVVGFALFQIHRDLGGMLANYVEGVTGIDGDDGVDIL